MESNCGGAWNGFDGDEWLKSYGCIVLRFGRDGQVEAYERVAAADEGRRVHAASVR